MGTRPKRTKAPPKRVWVVFDVKTMHIVDSSDAEPEQVFEDEVVYRYDLHGVKK